ncbi:hypothetical protein NDU88_000276 [Pleurodeles waltl]|uniref:Uncharacterized protein n=1 Tax=Pleurodeles waltl TaxID=8319 RepID=A0AAV7MJ92_PLEWA|nr:hypothetical protein NDU88_000276 [Pleurodeles waltl]
MGAPAAVACTPRSQKNPPSDIELFPQPQGRHRVTGKRQASGERVVLPGSTAQPVPCQNHALHRVGGSLLLAGLSVSLTHFSGCTQHPGVGASEYLNLQALAAQKALALIAATPCQVSRTHERVQSSPVVGASGAGDKRSAAPAEEPSSAPAMIMDLDRLQDSLKDFDKWVKKEVYPVLDEFLCHVAKTGETMKQTIWVIFTCENAVTYS